LPDASRRCFRTPVVISGSGSFSSKELLLSFVCLQNCQSEAACVNKRLVMSCTPVINILAG